MNIINHQRHKHIQFDPELHEYYFYPSGDKRKKSEAIQFDGITGWIASFAPEFDAVGQAKKSAKNPYSEWYGMTPEEILSAWRQKGEDSIERGNYIHKIIEDLVEDGVAKDEHKEIVDDFYRVMDEAGLEPIASELVLYNEEIHRATPVDLVCKVKETGKAVIVDCKTFEKGMEWVGYGGETFNHPLSHLSHSKYMKVTLQCSITQNWGERFYDTEFHPHGYCLLYTDHFEMIPTLYLPREVQIMEEYDLRRKGAA